MTKTKAKAIVMRGLHPLAHEFGVNHLIALDKARDALAAALSPDRFLPPYPRRIRGSRVYTR